MEMKESVVNVTTNKRKTSEPPSQEDRTKRNHIGMDSHPVKCCHTPFIKDEATTNISNVVDHHGTEEPIVSSQKISTTQSCEHGDQGI